MAAAGNNGVEPDSDEDDGMMDAGNNESINQDPEVRRGIRIQYRSLLNDVSSSRSELVSGNTVVLKEKIDATNAIFENVKHPREAALDAQCCSTIANLGKQKAQALGSGFSNFSTVEFCEKLITRLGRTLPTHDDDAPTKAIDRDGWIRLGVASQTFFKRSPPLHFLYGTLTRDPKPAQAQKQRRDRTDEKKDRQAPATKPKERDNFGPAEGEATTIEVEHILKILRILYKKNDHQPICYFEFVTNPESFSQTIENVFYTSFIVLGGFARMFLDDDQLPVIEPVEGAENREPDDISRGANDGETHQMVMSWTVKDWQDIVEAFDITRPLIPTRTSQKLPSASSSNSSIKSSFSPMDTKSSTMNGSTSQTDGSGPSTSRAGLPGPSSSRGALKLTKSTPSKPLPTKSKSNHIVNMDSSSDDDEPVTQKHHRKR